jgi:hypothetical protein
MTTTEADTRPTLDAELAAARHKAETALASLAREAAASGAEPSLAAIQRVGAALGVGNDQTVVRLRKMVAAIHERAVELDSVAVYAKAVSDLLRPYGGHYEQLIKAVEDARLKHEAVAADAFHHDHSLVVSLELARERAERIAKEYPTLFK